MSFVLGRMDMFGDEESMHRGVARGLVGLAPFVFAALHFGGQKAEYGRYSRGAGGGARGATFSRLLSTPVVPGRLDWFLHATSLLASAFMLNRVRDALSDIPLPNVVLLSLFIIHYLWRSIGFAMLVQNPKPMTLPLALSTSGFCLMNGWLQSAGLLLYDKDIAFGPRFATGVGLWLVGWLTNVHSDFTLINLRKDPSDCTYYIPRGGLFEYVSGANFAGEIVEWAGLCIAAGGTRATLAFAIFTFSNIAPRAAQHHQWYLEKFKDDYPKERKALVPFLW